MRPEAAPADLAFLPPFLVALFFFVSAILRFSPCLTAMDFFPDSYGAFRKVASVEALSVCARREGRARVIRAAVARGVHAERCAPWCRWLQCRT